MRESLEGKYSRRAWAIAIPIWLIVGWGGSFLWNECFGDTFQPRIATKAEMFRAFLFMVILFVWVLSFFWLLASIDRRLHDKR